MEESTTSQNSKYCVVEEIRLMKTVPNMVRQNGIAERMNRTLNERVRSMRIHSGLPRTFWVDAINRVAYLINRGPLVPLEFKLPEEVWTVKKNSSTIT